MSSSDLVIHVEDVRKIYLSGDIQVEAPVASIFRSSEETSSPLWGPAARERAR